MTAKTYYIHLCFNGKKTECDVRYKVSKYEYEHFEEFYVLDCFDEINNKAGDNHLFLDCGDNDDPVDRTWLYDYTLLPVM